MKVNHRKLLIDLRLVTKQLTLNYFQKALKDRLFYKQSDSNFEADPLGLVTK